MVGIIGRFEERMASRARKASTNIRMRRMKGGKREAGGARMVTREVKLKAGHVLLAVHLFFSW